MKALLVIDVQDEYMKRYDENLLAGINQRIRYFSEHQQLIIYIQNVKKLRSGKVVSKLAKELIVSSPYILRKESASAFSNDELQSLLEAEKVTEIESVGVDGCACVAASAADAQKMGYKVLLPCNCIGVQNKERFEKKKQSLQALDGVIISE